MAEIADIQREFTDALPRIEGLAGAYLRMRRSEKRDEAIAETVAIAWRAYLTLAMNSRDVRSLLGRIVEFAAKRVRCGGRLVGMQPVRDVMSDTARFRHGHHGSPLPFGDEDAAPEIIEALQDHRSPADQAVLNVDFADWLKTLHSQRRVVATILASGFNTVDAGRQIGVSAARIAQIRADLIEAWEQFHEDFR